MLLAWKFYIIQNFCIKLVVVPNHVVFHLCKKTLTFIQQITSSLSAVVVLGMWRLDYKQEKGLQIRALFLGITTAI